jgi:hypothetical protein
LSEKDRGLPMLADLATVFDRGGWPDARRLVLAHSVTVVNEEKPAYPSSNFDNDAVCYASEVRPSARGALEITDLQICYLSAGKLRVARIG